MSGSGQDGLKAGAEELALITKGLGDAIAELKELGMIGESNVGRGFEDVALSGMQLGHEGLAAQFKAFCERWEWGVRGLVQDGNEFAKRVGLSAGMFYEQDKYQSGTWKVVGAAFGANPNLTDEEVENMSWDDIRANGNFAKIDYSGKSFRDAAMHGARTWEGVAKDSPTAPALRRLLETDPAAARAHEQPGATDSSASAGEH
ncbi:hypothetical protein [Streptomyces sp. ISL-11]|uniref:hypothetical protein n=1 Tax=Streptomyces sp. ISL-11 TaxID=2819174 RepID=UPI001BE6DDA2|nr:hypothetical protein [Streptomyces sp. ISL-11]MBT2387388.1 hypothetical protein [Streptomyces sp. ISL-11]